MYHEPRLQGGSSSRKRWMQSVTDTEEETENINPTLVFASVAIIILLMVCFIILLMVCLRQSRSRSAPSMEILLEQRRRQRELIRRTRLRTRFGGTRLEAAGAIIDDNRIELNAAQAEEKRKLLLARFETNGVQATLKQADFLLMDDDSECDTAHTNTNGTEDNEEEGTLRLPVSRKSVHADHSVPNRCVICLDSYHVGDVIVWSANEACNHAFHLDCIMEYLVPLHDETHSPCPCCRQTFCADVTSSSIKHEGADAM